MLERRDVEIEVEGGDQLRGWLFVPADGSGPRPAISMAHGYGGWSRALRPRFRGSRVRRARARSSQFRDERRRRSPRHRSLA
jgi:hypothetical protein